MIHALARRPRAFDALRFVLEAGFVGERRVLQEERCAAAATVLDLGCGTGALAGSFAARGYVGVDMELPYLWRAADKHPAHRFLSMDGRALALRSMTFDVVVIGGVIHHLADRDAAAFLAEARRVLRPTGQLVLWEDVPTRSPWNIVGRLVQRLDEGDHIRPAEHYLDLVRKVFPAVRGYGMRSGVCDYVVVVARNAA
jgi:ubiquinone/menaquinone biosynthesis C-methylase UbiE